MGSFFVIFGKVAVILVMITVGYAITKRGILTEAGASEIAGLLVKLVTPCLIIYSFSTAGDDITPWEIFLSAGLAALSMFISILLSFLFFKKETSSRRLVFRFCMIFSNAGFMGLPLVQGIVGQGGVVYGSFYVVVFNVIGWTYGYNMMSHGAKTNLKVLLLNPGVLGLTIGLPIYFLGITLPNVILEPLAFFASINTPLAMLVIGSYIAKVDFKSFVTDPGLYKMSALRLILAPFAFFLVLLLIRPTPTLFLSLIIQSATPAAALAVMFTVQHNRDSELASKSVAVSTVLSVLTIPVFTILANLAIQYLY